MAMALCGCGRLDEIVPDLIWDRAISEKCEAVFGQKFCSK